MIRKLNLKYLTCCFFLLALVPFHSHSRELPEYIHCFAVKGQTIFAGGTKGLYVSIDEGEHWELTSKIPKVKDIQSIALLGNDIYITKGFEDSLFYSADEGKTWTSCEIEINGRGPNAILVYDNKIYAGFTGGLFVLADDKTTWTQLPVPVPRGSQSVWIFSVTKKNKELLVGTQYGVYASADEGETWWEINSGLTATRTGCLAAIGSHFIAGQSGGLYISNEKYEWSKLNNFPGSMPARAISVNEKGIYAASDNGIFFSADTGATWKEIYSSATVLNALALKEKFIFVSLASGGILRSGDNGQNWTDKSTPPQIADDPGMSGPNPILTYIIMACVFLFALWFFPLVFLWKVKKGKMIYLVNLVSGLTFLIGGIKLFCNDPPHRFLDFTNLFVWVIITSIWAAWGAILFIISLILLHRHRKNQKKFKT